jgi:hypothetical protein
MTANEPPELVKRAAAVVDRWLKGQPGVLDTVTPQPRPDTATPAPRPETAAQRFAKLDRSQPPRSDLPPWRDPRGT